MSLWRVSQREHARAHMVVVVSEADRQRIYEDRDGLHAMPKQGPNAGTSYAWGVQVRCEQCESTLALLQQNEGIWELLVRYRIRPAKTASNGSLIRRIDTAAPRKSTFVSSSNPRAAVPLTCTRCDRHLPPVKARNLGKRVKNYNPVAGQVIYI